MATSWKALLLAVLALGARAGAQVRIPADAPAVAWEGRYAVTPRGGARLAYPGIACHLAVEGDSLDLEAWAETGTVLFDVSADGGPFEPLLLTEGKGTYPLLRHGGARRHTLELVRRTENWQGTCELLGFTASGRFLAAPVLPSRRLLFLGDSITCGAMVAFGAPERLPMDPKIQASNARLAYGSLLARTLGAQVALVACGGRGLLRDYQGLAEQAMAPAFYGRTLPDEPAPWDPSRFVPDGVGLCIGSNDFGPGIPDEAAFVAAYAALVRRIRKDAPEALIVLIQSPVLADLEGQPPRRTVYNAYLAEVAAQLADPRVRVAAVPFVPGVPGDGHPTAEDHRALALLLAPLFRSALGW